jgi:hypothetical protein
MRDTPQVFLARCAYRTYNRWEKKASFPRRTTVHDLICWAPPCSLLLAAGAVARCSDVDKPALTTKARKVLAENCYRCHGDNGANEGGLSFVLNRQRLVERRKPTPGDPAKSKLFKRVTNEKDPMPPEGERLRSRPTAPLSTASPACRATSEE